MGGEQGPKTAGGKKRTFNKSSGGKGDKGDRKPHTGDRKPQTGGDNKKGGSFKKRDFKAQSKQPSSGMEVVRAEEPQKYKKINFNKDGAGATPNRRQKQKVSDLIKKLRVSARYPLLILCRSIITSC